MSQHSNPNLEGIDERLAQIKLNQEAKEAEKVARWAFYYEQLAKHAPFGGAERGGLIKDRWD